jgi:hypothetical protein
MSDCLFDSEFEAALLGDCERFSQETGIPFTVQFGTPTFLWKEWTVQIFMVKVMPTEKTAFRCESSKLGKHVCIIHFFYGDIFKYRLFKKRLVDILELPHSMETSYWPTFSLPYKSFQELKDCKRVYLDQNFDKVNSLAEATYIFEMMNDVHVMFARRVVDPERIPEEEAFLFQTCFVQARKGLGNDLK